MSLPEQLREPADFENLGTDLISAESCISEEAFRWEMEAIFHHQWINVGHVLDVPKPGDYVVKTLDFANTSLLLVHAQDGVIRGFRNVCTHRGNKLVQGEGGSCKGFSCNYHGWTFGLDGRLAHVPQEENFRDFDKSRFPLRAVRIELWNGFVFINLAPDPGQTLREFLGDLYESLEGYPFQQMTSLFVHRGEIRCNWKLLIDAFQEGYHFPFMHKYSLARNLVDFDGDSRINLSSFRFVGPHRLGGGAIQNPNHVPTPAEATAVRQVGGLYTGLPTELPWGVNPDQNPNWATGGPGIFPNFLLQFSAGGFYMTWTSWPVAVDRSIWEWRLYFPEPKTPGERYARQLFRCAIRDTVLEDLGTMETQHEGLASGAIDHFVLQDDELNVRHLHVTAQRVVQEYRQRKDRSASSPIKTGKRSLRATT